MRSWLLVGVVGWLGAGCGQPLEEPAYPTHSEFELPPSTQPADQAAAEEPPPAPRLRHPKTLGQTDEAYARGAAMAQPYGQTGAQGGTTVIINNNLQQQVSPTVVYTGPGVSGSVYGGRTGGSVSRGGSTGGGSAGGSTPPVGGDWPRVPSYGPR